MHSKIVAGGFLGSLITNITVKNASDVPGASGYYDDDFVVPRNNMIFTPKCIQNRYEDVFGVVHDEYKSQKFLRRTWDVGIPW